MTDYTQPPYPKVFIYWGPAATYADRVDTMVMFQKNFYLYGQWTTFAFLDANIQWGDVIYFPGGSAEAISAELQANNSMTAIQVRNKIQSYLDNYIHFVGVSAGAYLASVPYPGYDYFDIYDYSDDRDGSGNTGRVTLDIEPDYYFQDGELDILFSNGPVFYQTLPTDFITIATFDAIPGSGFNGPNAGNFIGTPAVLYRQGGSEEGAILLLTVKYEKGNAPKTAYKQFFKIFENTIVVKNII